MLIKRKKVSPVCRKDTEAMTPRVNTDDICQDPPSQRPCFTDASKGLKNFTWRSDTSCHEKLQRALNEAEVLSKSACKMIVHRELVLRSNLT